MRVIVVGDTGIKDAVIAAPFTDASVPILFVRINTIPFDVMAELERLAPTEILVFGGIARVDDSVVAALSSYAPVTRIAGPSVFATAVAASQTLYPIEPVEPPVEPPIEPPSGLFIPKLQGPILSHDGNPTVMSGNIVIDDGEVHNYSNILLRGRVTARNGSVVNIIDSELDGNQGPYCAAGWGGQVNLTRCEVWNAEDGFKDNIHAEQVTVHKLYRGAGAHMDCYQAQSTADASFKFCYMDAKNGSDLGNAAFQIKPEETYHDQRVIVEDSYINGGNYTVLIDNRNAEPHAEFHRCLWGGEAREGIKAGSAVVWDVSTVSG